MSDKVGSGGAYLFDDFESKVFAVDPQLRRLPFDSEELHWRDFEKLIARIAAHPKGANLTRADIRGLPGQSQDGVDVVGENRYDKRLKVFQCKRVRKVTRGQLKQWVQEFVKGKLASRTTDYFLCLAADVNQDTNLWEEWSQCEQELTDKGVSAHLWGRQQIEDMLRGLPELVHQLFGDEVRKRFCTSALDVSPTHATRFRSKYRNESFEGQLTLENEGIHCTVLLPGQSTTLSAALSFVRQDLRGATIVIPGDMFLVWIRWRRHAESSAGRPYAIHDISSKRFILQTPSVSLFLNSNEAEQLDWIIGQTWDPVKQALLSREARWRILRFSRIESALPNTYALVRVHRQLWKLILDFAKEHDVDEGSTPWHIFDWASGSLKIYTRTATDRLDAGYHLLIHAHYPEGPALPWERDLTLGWNPADLFGWRDESPSPRGVWDAQYAHDWLLNELVPAVLRWDYQRALRAQPWWRRVLGIRDPRLALQAVGDWAYSLALDEGSDFNAYGNDIAGLRAIAHHLQSHFNGGGTSVPVPAPFIDKALAVVELLAPFAVPLDEYYIRSKLTLSADMSVAAGVRQLRATGGLAASSFALDIALRCACAVLDDIKQAPTAELNTVRRWLEAIWERRFEDLLSRQVS